MTSSSPVVTRFAPSPTGFLHIGGARTALFNWLFARRHGGTFLLRIEDTDQARSTQEAMDVILDGLTWLGLEWDGEAIYQSTRADRHREVARQLLAEGKAYYCYTQQEEIAAAREAARNQGDYYRFTSPWRDHAAPERQAIPAPDPERPPPVVRLKTPGEGGVLMEDAILGNVAISASQVEDFVLLRSDGAPTYMLAVVVDDHDMGVTHVIRGDDHTSNTAKQVMIYDAMGWEMPEFAHIPLIHGADGAKLSKRHGALGVDVYRDMGYLPEALRNYLLRLGWSRGDEEIISTRQAIEWFGLEAVGKSPARFDMVKLDAVNGHYIREADDVQLVDALIPRLEALGYAVDDAGRTRLLRGIPSLKERAKTLRQLAEQASFYVASRPIVLNEKAGTVLASEEAQTLLTALADATASLEIWEAESLKSCAKGLAETQGVKLGALMQPVRAALTGSHASPSMFEVMTILGKEESLARMKDCQKSYSSATSSSV